MKDFSFFYCKLEPFRQILLAFFPILVYNDMACENTI